MALLTIPTPFETAPTRGPFDGREQAPPVQPARRLPGRPAVGARGVPQPAARRARVVACRLPRPERQPRLTVRGQAVLVVLVVAVVLGLSALGGGAAAPRVDAPASVVVQPGQTLWQVAGDIAPSADRRDVVDALIQANGLGPAGSVVAGQELVVPDLG